MIITLYQGKSHILWRFYHVLKWWWWSIKAEHRGRKREQSRAELTKTFQEAYHSFCIWHFHRPAFLQSLIPWNFLYIVCSPGQGGAAIILNSPISVWPFSSFYSVWHFYRLVGFKVSVCHVDISLYICYLYDSSSNLWGNNLLSWSWISKLCVQEFWVEN